MKFGLLGEVMVWGPDGPVDSGHTRQQSVLAALLADANRPVSVDQLLDRVWGDRPPHSARSTLLTYLTRLRRALTPVPIERRSTGYQITIGHSAFDLRDFTELLAEARAARDDEAADGLFRRALSLWRGEPLLGIDTPWANELRELLQRQRFAAELDHTDVLFRLGRHTGLLAELTARAGRHPLDERVAGHLILALYRGGRLAEATAQYQKLHRRLTDEVGTAPGPALRELYREMLASDQSVAPSVEVSDREIVPPCQLPPDPRTFVGRHDEIRDITAELTPDAGGSVPVVVVSGPPGVGKTALALRVAHRLRASYPDGQLYVNLQGYSADPPLAPAVVLARFLGALGVPANQIPADEHEQVSLYRSLLADRRILVVLDNAGAPTQVRPLLPGRPGCAALVTSRDHLRGLVAIDDATQVTLEVITHDDARTVLAGVLGADRVAAEPDAVDDLVTACARLPLALRIAAANLAANPHQSITAYARRLREKGALDQLSVRGDVAAAVGGAFDLSYARLPAPAARLFRLLGLVPGPDFGIRAAGALLAGSAEPLLDALSAASLVVPCAPGRYQFHDLIREYATTRVREDPDAPPAEIRLLDYYLHSAHAATRLLDPDATVAELPAPAAGVVPVRPATEAAALEWLDGERASLVAAALRARHGAVPRYAWQLAEVLGVYFWTGGHTVEGLAVCDAALAAARGVGDQRAEATVLGVAGMIHYISSRYGQAERHHERALAISARTGDLAGQATSLFNLGRVCSQVGSPEGVIDYHTRALALARQAGNLEAEALNINYLGVGHLSLGHPDEAVAHHRHALELGRKIGNHAIVCRVFNGLGIASWQRGDLRESVEYHQEALALARRIGNRHFESSTLICLAEARCDAGEYEQAIADARQGIETGLRIGERRHEVGGVEIIATARLRAGHPDGVLDDLTAALRQAEEIDFGYGHMSILLALAAAHRAIGDQDRALELAKESLRRIDDRRMEVLRGRALLELGLAQPATGYLREAVDLARRRGERLTEARAHHAYGLAEQAAGRPPRAHWQAAYELFADIGAPEAAPVRRLLARPDRPSPGRSMIAP